MLGRGTEIAALPHDRINRVGDAQVRNWNSRKRPDAKLFLDGVFGHQCDAKSGFDQAFHSVETVDRRPADRADPARLELCKNVVREGFPLIVGVLESKPRLVA